MVDNELISEIIYKNAETITQATLTARYTGNDPVFYMKSTTDSLIPIGHWKMNDDTSSTLVIDELGNHNGTSQRDTDLLSTTGKINEALNFNGVGGDKPIHHWKMNDVTGITVTDNEGGNNGTASVDTSTLTTSGKINTAIATTDGGADIQLASQVDESIFTYAFWVKQDETLTNWMRIFECGGFGDGGTSIQTGVIGTDTVSLYFGDSVGWDTSLTISTTQNIFTHIAFTYDGTTIKVYKNGAYDSETTANYISPLNSTKRMMDGYNGTIDDFRIYDKVLTRADIESIYNKGNGTEETSDYVELGNFSHTSEDNWSYGGWVKLRSIRDNPDSSRTEERQIIGKRHGDADTLSINDDLKVNFRLDDTPVISNSSINLNEWTHVFATYSYRSSTDTTARIYINGALDKERIGNEDAGGFGDSDMFLGWDSRFENVWDGELDDIRIYDSELTSTDISFIYNSTNGTEEEDVYWEEVTSGTPHAFIKQGEELKYKAVGDGTTLTKMEVIIQ